MYFKHKKAMMALESLTWALQILWYSIKELGLKSQPLSDKHNFLYDLTYWPSLLWPMSNSSEISLRQTFWHKFHKYQVENVAPRAYTMGFLRFDLVT